MTTAFEREILTHYWTRAKAEPFPRPSELYYTTVARFSMLGLLETDVHGVIHATEACRVYMEALDAVPFPVQRWVMPTQDNGSGEPHV